MLNNCYSSIYSSHGACNSTSSIAPVSNKTVDRSLPFLLGWSVIVFLFRTKGAEDEARCILTPSTMVVNTFASNDTERRMKQTNWSRRCYSKTHAIGKIHQLFGQEKGPVFHSKEHLFSFSAVEWLFEQKKRHHRSIVLILIPPKLLFNSAWVALDLRNL